MKLLLTSAGLANEKIGQAFLDLVGMPARQIRILMLGFPKTRQEREYVEEAKQELIDLGLRESNVVVFSINKRRLPDYEFLDFDAVYVCGGNTFYILNILREIKFLQKIKQMMKRGAVYVGVSAGSIIAGPNIEIAGWGKEGDRNENHLKNLEALDFTEITIFPHYHKELEKEVNEFRKKFKMNVLPLTDEQALLINGKEEKIIK